MLHCLRKMDKAKEEEYIKTVIVKASKKPLKKRIWDQRYLFLLMVPAIIWVAVICYAPMTGLYMAFTNYAPSTKGYFHDL